MVEHLPVSVPASESPLYGREETVRAVVEKFKRGVPTVGLEGPSGIGKSALLTEISKDLHQSLQCTVVELDVAQLRSEDLAIAALFSQLKDAGSGRNKLIEALQERASRQLPSVLKSLFGAVAADLLKLATDKAEHTIEAVRDAISGETPNSEAETALAAIHGENRRYFLTELLSALDDAGVVVTISIDNLDQADSGVIEFVRFLVQRQPRNVRLLLSQNTEVGDNRDWDLVVADVRARGGALVVVDALRPIDAAEWFTSVVGVPPTTTELDDLMAASHGRPLLIKLAVEEIRESGAASIKRDYEGYYSEARRRLGADARTIGELLAVIKSETMVPNDWLAEAALQLGVKSIAPALDELRGWRQLKEQGTQLALSHSLAQRSWQNTINATRKKQLADAWLSVVKDDYPNMLTRPEAAGVISVVMKPLIEHQSLDDAADFGSRLIAAGQISDGLELLDQTWKFGLNTVGEGSDLNRHALLAARTRLDLGRYDEVDEPLTQAEHSSSLAPKDKLEILLLRMKLALRRNSYPTLWHLQKSYNMLAQSDPEAMLEGQQILNMAYRDLLDVEGIRSTAELLKSWRDVATRERENAIDRSLARSYAKLGDMDAALEHAESAVSSSVELGSIRAIGNSKLAIAEVHRYRRELVPALTAYRDAAAIGRATGNRDSLLWSLLGEVSLQIEAGEGSKTSAAMAELGALLTEPGYNHPLESAHFRLMQHLLKDGEILQSEEVLSAYEKLGIDWPKSFLKSIGIERKLREPVPI